MRLCGRFLPGPAFALAVAGSGSGPGSAWIVASRGSGSGSSWIVDGFPLQQQGVKTERTRRTSRRVGWNTAPTKALRIGAGLLGLSGATVYLCGTRSGKIRGSCVCVCCVQHEKIPAGCRSSWLVPSSVDSVAFQDTKIESWCS